MQQYPVNVYVIGSNILVLKNRTKHKCLPRNFSLFSMVSEGYKIMS